MTTSDGYMLEMHRITGGPKSPTRLGKKPVFLMHGLLDSSGTWVIMRPTHGLGKFQLLTGVFWMFWGDRNLNKVQWWRE